MNKDDLMPIIASDSTEILRDKESKIGYFILRMYYKTLLALKRWQGKK